MHRFIEYQYLCNDYCGLRNNGNGLITIIIDNIIIILPYRVIYSINCDQWLLYVRSIILV